MNMIDQYVCEVGENLPEKQRADLEKEIRSLIEDTLEERSKSTGRPIDDDMIVEVLKEFGSPAKMAASYQPAAIFDWSATVPDLHPGVKDRYPRLCLFWLWSVWVWMRHKELTTYKTMFDLIIHSAGTLFQSLLAALGNIVFIFAMIERFVPQGIEKEKEWDPRSMKPVEEPDKVSRFEQVWIILWSAVAVLLFNFYPQLLRLVFNQNGTWYSFTFLSDTFFKYVPALTILWMLEIFLCILLFMTGAWQTGTRWFKVALKVLNIVLLAVIIAGPPILKLGIEGFPGSSGCTEEPIGCISCRIQWIPRLVGRGPCDRTDRVGKGDLSWDRRETIQAFQ